MDGSGRDGSEPSDAGAGDGGDADAGDGVDAGPVLDETSCDDFHAGAILCDGFEGSPDFARWTEVRGAAAITADLAYRGARSLYAHSTASGVYAYLYSDALPSVTSGEIYARAYLYVPSASALPALTLLHVEEDANPWDDAEVRIQEDTFGLETRAVGVTSRRAGPVVPREAWTCVELRVLVSDVGGEVELFVDGASVGVIPEVDTRPASPYGTFYVGITVRDTGTAGTIDLYLDEIVLARTRVGCDP